MTTDTNSTGTETTTQGASSQPAASAATAADTNGQQQQAASAGATDTQTSGQQADGQQTGAEKSGDDKGEQAAAGAPESYEFKQVGDVPFDDAVVNAYSEVAKELNLPQDAAQKVLDKMAPVIQARQVEQIAAVRKQWGEQSRNDKEFGGDKLDENLAYATQVRTTFGTPELTKLLNDTGLGDHPELVRFFVRTGKALSEDRFVGGGSGGGRGNEPTAAQRMYPNMNP